MLVPIFQRAPIHPNRAISPNFAGKNNLGQLCRRSLSRQYITHCHPINYRKKTHLRQTFVEPLRIWRSGLAASLFESCCPLERWDTIEPNASGRSSWSLESAPQRCGFGQDLAKGGLELTSSQPACPLVRRGKGSSRFLRIS